MTDQPLDWLKEQPAAGLILAAYADREAQLPKRPARSLAPATADVAAAVTPDAPSPEADAAVQADAAADETENADAWVPRVATIDGIETAQMSQLHGGLIARGLLKYELFGRQIGLRYRLTPEGRRALDFATAAITAGPLSGDAAA